MKLLSKAKNWITGKYYEFLLWHDNISGNSDVSIGPIFGGSTFKVSPEVAQAVLELREIAYREGVGKIKHKINTLVKVKTKDEYHRVLSEIEDLIDLARETDPKKIQLMQILRGEVVFTGGKDIKTSLDKAKMIDRRIGHFKELSTHIESRNMIRAIRKAEREGNKEEALKLQKEWQEKYGYKKRR